MKITDNEEKGLPNNKECPSVEQEEYNLTGKRLDLSNTIFIRNISLAKKEGTCSEDRREKDL
ncbi:MAG: hypothetical protein GY820_39985 [Gammaproteobacteria bacterium]|nr:hypothetical protein [Gammaproteobacteria bacterium]